MIPYIEDTMADWDTLGVPYEVLDQEEIRYRWPVIGPEQEIGVGLHEPLAGVVRARRSIEAVAEVFRKEGGDVTLAGAELGERDGRQLNNVTLQTGGLVSAAQFVFACGPWFPKVFPDLMGKRLRISMGNTFYFAVPPGDNSYSFPSLPSYGVPGVTGWPALGRDHPRIQGPGRREAASGTRHKRSLDSGGAPRTTETVAEGVVPRSRRHANQRNPVVSLRKQRLSKLHHRQASGLRQCLAGWR